MHPMDMAAHAAPNHTSLPAQNASPALRPAAHPVAERRVSDALALLRRLEKLLQRFVAAADAADPSQQVIGGKCSADWGGLRLAKFDIWAPCLLH